MTQSGFLTRSPRLFTLLLSSTFPVCTADSILTSILSLRFLTTVCPLRRATCCPLFSFADMTASSKCLRFRRRVPQSSVFFSAVLGTVENWCKNCRQRECGHNQVAFPSASSRRSQSAQVRLLDPIFQSTQEHSIRSHWSHTACICLHHTCAVCLEYTDET